LWGRASRLPVSVEEARIASPRDLGMQLPRERARVCHRTWIPQHRPSGPPSAAQRRPIGVVSRVVKLKGCDHADGTPAASFRAGRDPFNVPPGGARYDNVRIGLRCREDDGAHCQTPHPEDRPCPPIRGVLGSVLVAAAVPSRRKWEMERERTRKRVRFQLPSGSSGGNAGPLAVATISGSFFAAHCI